MMLLSLLALNSADAAVVDVTVCIKVQMDFEDSDVVDNGIVDAALSGDTWATNGSKKARGIRVFADTVGPGGTPSAWADGSTGCATLPLAEGVTYDFGVMSSVSVDGRTIYVKDDEASGFSEKIVASGVTVPTGGGTFTRYIGALDGWQLVATAGLVAQRIHPLVNDDIIHIYLNPTSSPCPGETCASDGKVYMDGVDSVDYRYNIASLIGHAALQNHVGMVSANTSPYPGIGPPDPLDCSRGVSFATMGSREWQSMAIVEGFARYVAAGTFNDESESDCGYVHHRSEDYNGDLTLETGVPEGISCKNGPSDNPELLLGSVPTRDQHYYVCDSYGYPFEHDGKSTVLDWLRFFWQMDTDPTTLGDWTQGEIIGILDAAQPDTWNTIGYNPGTGDDPYQRIRQSLLRDATEWDTRATTHGINRGY